MNARELFEQILAMPAGQRAERVRAAGPIENVLPALAEEVERLAITRVARAVDAGHVIVDLSDVLGGSRDQARSRRAFAQSLAYAGRFEEAAPVFDNAIEIASAAGLLLEMANGRLASIHALVHLGRYDEALAAGEAARAVFLRAGQVHLAGRADSSLGGVYQKSDRPDEALKHFDRARPALQEDAVALAQLDSNRGLALQSLDDFVGAEQAFRAALPAFERAGMTWACAIVEGNLAVLATRQGRLQEALYFFERERRHLERDAAPAELARTLMEQAEALKILGVLEPALADYKTALPILQDHGQVREAAQARAGIGRALARLGRTAEAERFLAEAAGEYQQLGQAAERARLDLIRSEVALTGGDVTQAWTLAAAALSTLCDRPVDSAVARYHLARAAFRAGDQREAESALTAALCTARELSIAPLLADVLHMRGLVRRAVQQSDGAVADLREAVRHVERVRGSLQAGRFRASFHGDRQHLYEDLVVAALECGGEDAAAIAFSAAECSKSRSLLDLMHGTQDPHEFSVAQTPDVAEAAMATGLQRLCTDLNALYSQLADERLCDEPREASTRTRNRIQTLERRLENLESRLATTRGLAALYARPIELSAAQALLDDETALVEYFTAHGELLGFVVRQGEVRVFRRLARIDELNALVQRLYFQIRRAMRPGALTDPRHERFLRDAQRELGVLYERLLMPLEGELTGVRHLRIVPHGALHSVPFSALWDGRRYLIEKHAVSLLPSASLLAAGRHRWTSGASDTASLVVGIPDHRAPSIACEAGSVAAALQTDRLLLGADATADRVIVEAPRAGTIHFSCHGHFSADVPAASGLRLADRWLTVREVLDLRLRAGLVTLAACETGRNVVAAGDELLGLVRAFLAAGAASLVVSLWRVSDKISGELMTSFYNHYVRAGERTPAALRAAQLAAMSQHPHPAFWAPYAVVGGS